MKRRLTTLLLAVLMLMSSFSTVFAAVPLVVRTGNELNEVDFLASTTPIKNESNVTLNPVVRIKFKPNYIINDNKLDVNGKVPEDVVFDDFVDNATLNGTVIRDYFDVQNLEKAVSVTPGSNEITIDFRRAKSPLTPNTSYTLNIKRRHLNLKDLSVRADILNYYSASNVTNKSPFNLNFTTGSKLFNDAGIKVFKDGIRLYAGDKGVAPELKELKIVPADGFFVAPDAKAEDISLLYNDFDQTNEVEVKLQKAGNSTIENEIILSLDGKAANEHIAPQSLRELRHYHIRIPSGFFIDDKGNRSSEIKHNFTTSSYEVSDRDKNAGKITDILIPDRIIKEKLIDFDKNVIYAVFLDNISISQEAVLRPDDFFNIYERKLGTTTWDKIPNSDLMYAPLSGIRSNRLEIRYIMGSLKDTSEYRVELKPRAVYLTRSNDFEKYYSGKKIYNGYVDFTVSNSNYIEKVGVYTGGEGKIPVDGKPIFPTGDWPRIDYSDKNHVKINFKETATGDKPLNNFPLNPFIKITFKYDTEIANKSKIKITSDAETFSMDVNSVSANGKELYIDLGNLYRNGVNLLRYDTAYRVTIEEGALTHKSIDRKFVDGAWQETKHQTSNPKITIDFITGREVTDHSMLLTSNPYAKPIESPESEEAWKTRAMLSVGAMDDIRKICPCSGEQLTKLKKDGKIYVVFHDNDNNILEVHLRPGYEKKQLINDFKLYQIPKAIWKEQNDHGLLEDIKYEFDKDRKPTNAGEEVLIKSVRITPDKKSIEITPKYPLLELNQYRISFSRNDVIAIGGFRTLKESINEKIWTAPNSNVSALEIVRADDANVDIPRDDYLATEIIDAKFLASDKARNFVIQGSATYSPQKPIRIPFKNDIVFNPCYDMCCENPKEPIYLEYGYYTDKRGDSTPTDGGMNFVKLGSIPITKYEIENRNLKAADTDADIPKDREKRSTLLIYPGQALKSGHDYRLVIDLCDNNTSPIVSRGNVGIGNKAWNLYFTVEGEQTKDQAIYKFDWAGKNLYSISDIKDILRGVEAGKDGEYYPLPKFKIYGYNFNENISSLTFRGQDGKTFVIDNSRTIKVKDSSGNKIDTKPLIFDNVSMIEGYIPLDILRKMVEEKGACFSRDTFEGLYSLELSFANGRAVSIDTVKDALDESEFAIVDRPYIYKSFPEDGAKYIDADSLKSGNTTSFQNQEDRSNLRNELRELADEIGADSSIKDIFDKISESNQNIDRLKSIFSGAYIIEREAQVRAEIEKLFEWESDEVRKDYTDKLLNFYRSSKIRERNENQRTYFDKFFAALDKFKTINGGGVLTQGLDKEPADLLKDKYYIQVQYKDFLKSLALYPTAITGITMHEEIGQGEAGKENYIDTAGKIYLTEKDGVKTFWIPLTKRPEENKEFLVTILENAFVEYRLTGLSVGNAQCSFRFSTNVIPRHSRLYEGSVPENYDLSYPIAIDMDTEGLKESKFEIFDSTKVYFRDEAGKIYNPARQVLRKDKDGGVRIYVFLPLPRLKVGRYDIILSNTGENIKSEYVEELVYAVFSVVKKGDIPPNEIFWMKAKTEDADIKAYRDTSRDDVILKKPKIEMGKVEMDLEDFTKTTALTRNLEIPNANAIGELVLRAKEGEVSFNGVRPVVDNVLRLKVGGVPSGEKAMLRGKLKAYHVKSEFFKLSDPNFAYGEGIVSLKYEGDDIEGYKILRYDEKKRKFIELETEVDEMNQRATAKTIELGVFVVAKKR